MACEITSKFTLFDAPAGSGKTEKIVSIINEIQEENKICQILCITYTNRAANEMMNRMNNENIVIATIHSALSDIFQKYFVLDEIVKYYFVFFELQIKKDIENKKSDKELHEKICQTFYIDDISQFTFEKIREMFLTKHYSIKYRDRKFSNYIYGNLGHDDFIKFCAYIVKKNSKLRKVLGQRFNYIFIDEYQDTSEDILNLFYDLALNSQTYLALFGDSMQQIYPGRVGAFQKIINEEFLKDKSLNTNYRSQGDIVNLLNNLNPQNTQIAKRDTLGKPKFFITDKFPDSYNKEYLNLVPTNPKIYSGIGSEHLYKEYGKIEVDGRKIYSYTSENNAADILNSIVDINSINDCPDDLWKLLGTIYYADEYYRTLNYGACIQLLKGSKFFDSNKFLLKNHQGKSNLISDLKVLFSVYNDDQISIKDFINILQDEEFGKDFQFISNYSNVLDIKINEVNNVLRHTAQKHMSTFHAVKGEGYDKVRVYIEDSGTINLYMYSLLEQISCMNYINNIDNIKGIKGILLFPNAEKLISDFESMWKIKYSDFKTETFSNSVKISAETLVEDLCNINDTIKKIYKKKIVTGNVGVSNFKKFISGVKAEIKKIDCSELNYKLFYVACSRAKKELEVYVLRNKVIEYENELKEKMESLGFEVLLENIGG